MILLKTIFACIEGKITLYLQLLFEKLTTL